jgi:hypothetical protein
MPSDSDMLGPGVYETNAQSAISSGEPGMAQVHAILALAAAVNRLAAAQETIAATQG